MIIGVVVPELMGHMNPAIELVRELCALGHQAMLLVRYDGCARADRLGVPSAAYAWSAWPSGSLARPIAELGRQTGLRSITACSEFMRAANRALLEHLDEAIDLFRLEALVVDEMLGGACLVAARRGMPYATVCNALSMSYDPALPPPIFDWQPRLGWLGRARDAAGWALFRWLTRRATAELEAYRRRHNIPLFNADGDYVYRGRVQVAQQPAWLDFPRAWPAPFLPTGAWVTRDQEDVPFPWQWLDGRPLLYVSFGTLAQSKREHRMLGGQTVVSTGGRPVFPDATNDVLTVPWAPHYALIQRADLVVTHGGINTTLACLAAGKLPAILPQAFDQPGIAARVRALAQRQADL